MGIGRLALRATVGGLMVGHGMQKLKGSFGGPGLERTAEMMGNLGLHPAREQALAAGLSESVGGGLTALGLLSPLGPAMIMGTMAVAIKKVHAKNGVWVTNGGFEYNLVLIAAAFALAVDGPGAISVDRLARRSRSGFGWGLVSLLLATGSAAATLKLAERLSPDEQVAEAKASDPAEENLPAE